MSPKAQLAAFFLFVIWAVGGPLLYQHWHSTPKMSTPQPTPAPVTQPAPKPVAAPAPTTPSPATVTLDRIRQNLDAQIDTLRNDAIADYTALDTQAMLHQVLVDAEKQPQDAGLALNLILRQNDVTNFKRELLDIEQRGPATLKADAVTLLLTLPGTEGIAFARKYHQNSDATLRQTVVHALAQRKDKADLPLTVPMLVEALQDATPLIRKIAGNALHDIAGQDFKFDYTQTGEGNTQAISSIKSWAKTAGYAVQ